MQYVAFVISRDALLQRYERMPHDLPAVLGQQSLPVSPETDLWLRKQSGFLLLPGQFGKAGVFRIKGVDERFLSVNDRRILGRRVVANRVGSRRKMHPHAMLQFGMCIFIEVFVIQ